MFNKYIDPVLIKRIARLFEIDTFIVLEQVILTVNKVRIADKMLTPYNILLTDLTYCSPYAKHVFNLGLVETIDQLIPFYVLGYVDCGVKLKQKWISEENRQKFTK